MSSLTGALDHPTAYQHGLPPLDQEQFPDEDVDMNPPSADEVPPKEEENAMSGALAHEDEEMEDLFGNDADDAKPDVADAKSDR